MIRDLEINEVEVVCGGNSDPNNPIESQRCPNRGGPIGPTSSPFPGTTGFGGLGGIAGTF